MKILITTDLFTTETNGVVTSVRNLESELRARGHEVRVLTLSENRHSRKEGNVYFVRSIPFAVYPNVRMPTSYRHRLIREIARWKPDVIHSQCEFFSLRFAKYISRVTGAPIVHTYHTMYEQYVKYVLPSRRLGKVVVRVLSRLWLHRAHTIIVPTKKIEHVLRGYKMKNPIRVIPSGISLEQHKVRISHERRQEKRHEIGISDDRTILLNLGRLGAEKNIGELLRFFAEAKKKNEGLCFLIVGDGPAREELCKLAETLGVKESVFFTGMVKPSEVQEYYQLGDVFVSASTSETQGLTYIEAAANGLPLLCRHDECLDGVLYEGENGFSFTEEEEFLDRLDRMLSEDGFLERAGKRSEEIARIFDKSTFGESVDLLYREVIEDVKGKAK